MHKHSMLLGKFILDPVDAKHLSVKKLLLFLAATNIDWELYLYGGVSYNRSGSVQRNDEIPMLMVQRDNKVVT